MLDNPGYGMILSKISLEKDLIEPVQWMKEIGIHGVLPSGITIAMISGQHRVSALQSILKEDQQSNAKWVPLHLFQHETDPQVMLIVFFLLFLMKMILGVGDFISTIQ